MRGRLRDHRQPTRSLPEAVKELAENLKAELDASGTPPLRRWEITERLVLLLGFAEALRKQAKAKHADGNGALHDFGG